MDGETSGTLGHPTVSLSLSLSLSRSSVHSAINGRMHAPARVLPLRTVANSEGDQDQTI